MKNVGIIGVTRVRLLIKEQLISLPLFTYFLLSSSITCFPRSRAHCAFCAEARNKEYYC